MHPTNTQARARVLPIGCGARKKGCFGKAAFWDQYCIVNSTAVCAGIVNDAVLSQPSSVTVCVQSGLVTCNATLPEIPCRSRVFSHAVALGFSLRVQGLAEAIEASGKLQKTIELDDEGLPIGIE